jgi:hypothetical protein
VEGQQLHQEGAYHSQEEQDRLATTKRLSLCYLNGHISELFPLLCGILIQRGPRGGAMDTRGGARLTLTPLKLQ